MIYLTYWFGLLQQNILENVLIQNHIGKSYHTSSLLVQPWNGWVSFIRLVDGVLSEFLHIHSFHVAVWRYTTPFCLTILVDHEETLCSWAVIYISYMEMTIAKSSVSFLKAYTTGIICPLMVLISTICHSESIYEYSRTSLWSPPVEIWKVIPLRQVIITGAIYSRLEWPTLLLCQTIYPE